MNALMQQINKLLAQITVLRIKLILKKCKDYLGKDFTNDFVVPDEFACAQAVTTLLVQCGVFPYVITGTWTLNQALQSNRGWIPVSNPAPGDIIISPTGTARRKTNIKNGHVGIVGEKGIIYSNDSYTGKWMANYDLISWRARYEEKGAYPVYFYRYISVL